MSMRALSSFREKRWRVALGRDELIRLSSMVDLIKPEIPSYQQILTKQLKDDKLDVGTEESLRILICFDSLLPMLEEFIKHGLQEEKHDRARFSVTDEEVVRLRVINYCAQNLPDLPSSIAWGEFAAALWPLLRALDRSAFEHVAVLVSPKKVTCTIDDLKRGRDLRDEPAEISGISLNKEEQEDK
jgi:hypothetical protein